MTDENRNDGLIVFGLLVRDWFVAFLSCSPVRSIETDCWAKVGVAAARNKRAVRFIGCSRVKYGWRQAGPRREQGTTERAGAKTIPHPKPGFHPGAKNSSPCFPPH